MSPEEIAELRTKRYNGTVVMIRKVHPELMMIRVRPDKPLSAHHPGQYTTLGLGNWEPRFPGVQAETLTADELAKLVRRTYSISSPIIDETGNLYDPAKTGWLEFYIVLVTRSEKGTPPALTPRLFMLKEGDRVNIGDKITGNYTLDPVRPDDAVIFLSTGTGEAPHNYMVWELLRRNHRGRIVAACCVRYRRDLGYLALHEDLARRFKTYAYLPLTTRDEAVVHKVYIQDLIRSGELERAVGQRLNPDKTHVFLCGNPSMIGVPEVDRATGTRTYPRPEGAIELLEQKGLKADHAATKFKGSIHFEEYW